MSIRSFLARWASRAAAVAAFAWTGASAPAADVTPPPPPVVAPGAVSVGGAPGCETCQHGVAGGCATCGKLGGLMHKDWLHKNKGPYPVTLCPGSCFGYFQTQWRKWDDACPYPYLGIGVGDAPRTMTPPGTGLPQPRPIDPKMPEPKKTGSLDLPSIPTAPTGSKFAP